MSSPTESSHHLGSGPPHNGARAAARAATRALDRADRARSVYYGLIAGLWLGVIAVIAWNLRTVPVKVAATVSHATPEMPEQVVVRDNQVSGTDSAKLPFTIETVRGYQDKDDNALYHLEDLAGKFRRDNGNDLHVKANTGTYRSDRRLLQLNGQVVISELPRFEAHMDSATVDVGKRSLVSKSPVAVTLENGHIAADSLLSEDNGRRMLFTGKVKAHFDGSNQAPAAATEQGGNQ